MHEFVHGALYFRWITIQLEVRENEVGERE